MLSSGICVCDTYTRSSIRLKSAILYKNFPKATISPDSASLVKTVPFMGFVILLLVSCSFGDLTPGHDCLPDPLVVVLPHFRQINCVFDFVRFSHFSVPPAIHPFATKSLPIWI